MFASALSWLVGRQLLGVSYWLPPCALRFARQRSAGIPAGAFWEDSVCSPPELQLHPISRCGPFPSTSLPLLRAFVAWTIAAGWLALVGGVVHPAENCCYLDRVSLLLFSLKWSFSAPLKTGRRSTPTSGSPAQSD